jgi:hypothetical protein
LRHGRQDKGSHKWQERVVILSCSVTFMHSGISFALPLHRFMERIAWVVGRHGILPDWIFVAGAVCIGWSVVVNCFVNVDEIDCILHVPGRV